MLLPRDPELQGDGFHHSLWILRESLGYLLGSKENLTPSWAESVRFIIEDVSSAIDPLSCAVNQAQNEQECKAIEDEISSLRGEITDLESALKEEDSKRSNALNRYLDLKGNIRVFCRVRPLLKKEENAPLGLAVSEGSNNVNIITSGKRKKFDLDKVFLPTASQDDVFVEVEPVVRSALDGRNVCIFSYGQTGTGKTFTMEGTVDFPGMIPRTLWKLFHHTALDNTVSFHLTLSMVEVYMGSLRDLLAPPTKRSADQMPKCLLIQTDPRGNVEVENLTEFIITDFDQANKLYEVGTLARSVGRTNANETSSRSHCLLRITVSRVRRKNGEQSVSKIWLVDLGGSERLLKTQATGQTLEEGKAINLSLSALGDVINALRKKENHIPYRNSKLTQILRDSLGNESKILMLVHASPKETDVGESICSLGFASRARGIHLGQELSESARQERAKMMQDLVQQMAACDHTCQNIRSNLEQMDFLVRKKEALLLVQPAIPSQDNTILESTTDDAVDDEDDDVKEETSVDSNIPSNNDDEFKPSYLPARVGKNRFMMPTASSRQKRNPNQVVATATETLKTKKKSSGKSSYESKKKSAKIVPLDFSPPVTQQQQSKQSETDIVLKQKKPLFSTILAASSRIMGGNKVKTDQSLRNNRPLTNDLTKETLVVEGKISKKKLLPTKAGNRMVSVAEVDCNFHIPFTKRI